MSKLVALDEHTSPETSLVIADYPYGFQLRCAIRYWIETNKKGQRFCSATTNPHKASVVWNNPKRSIYYPILIMHKVGGEGKDKDYITKSFLPIGSTYEQELEFVSKFEDGTFTNNEYRATVMSQIKRVRELLEERYARRKELPTKPVVVENQQVRVVISK